jgi:hypothetical protein
MLQFSLTPLAKPCCAIQFPNPTGIAPKCAKGEEMLRIIIAAVMAFTLAGTYASAYADGIAIVQAVEQSSGVCSGKSAAKAFECAKKKCMKGGAAKEDCLEMAWCLDGWTVDVFMQSKEGPHWHEFHCGWNTRAEAESAGKLACNPERKKDLMECATVQIYDPEAKGQMEE